MPLIYNDTTYNYSNTKNINLDSTNEVKILQYKKIYELKTVKIGSNGITDVDGTTVYQVGVKEQLYGNFDSIGFELKSNSTCQYNITSYDEETGVVNISIKSSLPNINVSYKLYTLHYLWLKPYTFTYVTDEGVGSTIVTRKLSNEFSASINAQLYNGNTIYHGDILNVNASLTDTENYKFKKTYPYEVSVNDNLQIKFETYKKKTTTVTSTSGPFAVDINGFTYYPATGVIQLEKNLTDVSISGFNNVISYNSSTGQASYTIYGARANANVTATITYWE